jgi:hypothetical protein
MNQLTAFKSRSNKFWKQVNIGHPNICWPWQGTLQKSGYGDFDFRLNNVRYRCSAHRVSYMLTYNRKIPKGFCVLHSCDNKQCANPNHLSIGTQSDNIHDMMKKDRHPRLKGENAPGAKLTYQNIITIRQRAQNGEKLCIIAKDFSVNPSQISRIVAKKRWK